VFAAPHRYDDRQLGLRHPVRPVWTTRRGARKRLHGSLID
jgi:hypothetical protein